MVGVYGLHFVVQHVGGEVSCFELLAHWRHESCLQPPTSVGPQAVAALQMPNNNSTSPSPRAHLEFAPRETTHMGNDMVAQPKMPTT